MPQYFIVVIQVITKDYIQYQHFVPLTITPILP